jgi:hypothetical protein
MSYSRYVPVKNRNNLMEKQEKKCANSPDEHLRFIGNYECPCWKRKGSNMGVLEKSDLDRIIEFSQRGTNDKDNLQILCLDCYREKTTNFACYKAERRKIERAIAKLKIDYGLDEDRLREEPEITRNENLKIMLKIEKEKTKRQMLKKLAKKNAF